MKIEREGERCDAISTKNLKQKRGGREGKKQKEERREKSQDQPLDQVRIQTPGRLDRGVEKTQIEHRREEKGQKS